MYSFFKSNALSGAQNVTVATAFVPLSALSAQKKRRMSLQSGLVKKFLFFRNTGTVVFGYNFKNRKGLIYFPMA